MGNLREIKDRIGSVRSTLKITNAMKLVASAKLRKAQQAVEALRPYEATLASILSDAGGVSGSVRPEAGQSGTAVVVFSSNSSLCGAFNSNVLRKAKEVIGALEGKVDVFAAGRKVADPLRKSGFPSVSVPGKNAEAPLDLNDLVAHPSYAGASRLAQALMDAYDAGTYSRVVLVYNHFVSTSRQDVLAETYLPFTLPSCHPAPYCHSERSEESLSASSCHSERSEESLSAPSCHSERSEEFIFEPSAALVADSLLPQVIRLKVYTVLLDSVASEHAARTVAMQTASDNAQDILDTLTLEYNKGRQQQITSEILDIVGGSQQ